MYVCMYVYEYYIIYITYVPLHSYTTFKYLYVFWHGSPPNRLLLGFSVQLSWFWHLLITSTITILSFVLQLKLRICSCLHVTLSSRPYSAWRIIMEFPEGQLKFPVYLHKCILEKETLKFFKSIPLCIRFCKSDVSACYPATL